MSDRGTFTVGPPEPILDSRRLPAVSGDEEDDFVTGADLGADHPDNGPEPPDEEVGLDTRSAPTFRPDASLEPPPSTDELDALVTDVDPEAVDAVGFDDSDLGEPVAADDRAAGAVQGGS